MICFRDLAYLVSDLGPAVTAFLSERRERPSGTTGLMSSHADSSASPSPAHDATTTSTTHLLKKTTTPSAAFLPARTTTNMNWRRKAWSRNTTEHQSKIKTQEKAIEEFLKRESRELAENSGGPNLSLHDGRPASAAVGPAAENLGDSRSGSTRRGDFGEVSLLLYAATLGASVSEGLGGASRARRDRSRRRAGGRGIPADPHSRACREGSVGPRKPSGQRQLQAERRRRDGAPARRRHPV